jgi:amino acid transporter
VESFNSDQRPHFDAEVRLSQSLGLLDVVVYGLLFFVPIAPVAVFGAVFNLSHGMVAATYLLGGLAMAFSALSYSEMARRIPLSGSVYSYVTGGAGPVFGFLAGWALLLDYILSPALLAVLAAAALASEFPASGRIVWLFLFVAVPFAINLLGITVNVRVGKAMLAFQLLILAIFIAVALVRLRDVPHANLLAPIFQSSNFRLSILFGALPVAVFSYIGFDAVSTLNEEAKGGGETVSKATIILLLIVTLLFTAQVYLAALFVPLGSRFAPGADDVAFYTVSTQVVGPWFLPVITFTNTAIAILANALIAQAASARVIFAMARDGRFPAWLSRLNRRQVPANALSVVALVSLIIAFIGRNEIEAMVTMVTFGAMSAYLMLHAAVGWFFRNRADRSLFRHLISPALGGLVLIYAMLNANARAQWLGLSWLAVGGLLAAILWRRGAFQKDVFHIR